jgi:hypothetical protein
MREKTILGSLRPGAFSHSLGQLQTPNDVRSDGSFLQLLPPSLAPDGDACCSVSKPQRRAHFKNYAQNLEP